MTAPAPPRPAAHLIAADLGRLGVGELHLDADLRTYSHWRCGGRGDLVIHPRSKDAVSRLLSYFHEREIPWSVIGEGSNLFFDDAGVRTPLIHIGSCLNGIAIDGAHLVAEAGAWAPAVALKAMRAELTGIEHTIGIPGTFGGLVLMNGGSLRQSVGSHIVKVEVAERNGTIRSLSRRACGFGYRRSTLQRRDIIVLSATLALRAGKREAMRRHMLDIMASRRRRFPRNLPNCGSVFVSDPALFATFGPPGAVIEHAGLKGARVGGAMVSPRHANFIVNLGHARSSDILALIARVRDIVATNTGRRMRCEVRFMDSAGVVREAHEWLDDEVFSIGVDPSPSEALSA